MVVKKALFLWKTLKNIKNENNPNYNKLKKE